MADWPGTIPPPMITSYSADQNPRILRTTMESGPQRMTLYSGHKRITGSATVVLDLAQLGAFNSMYESARLGTTWINGVPLNTGLGVAAHRVRMNSVSYKVMKQPDLITTVTFTFETDEQNAA